MDTQPFPIAGRDYPKNWSEFMKWFSDDAACAALLSRLRWPSGFTCPACEARAIGWAASRGRFICSSCRHQASLTAGTIFEGTRKPLTAWFAAIWYVTNQKLGVSALGLQRALGFGSYQTAWSMLHKLRRAMVRPGRERLAGKVEVDETYVGGEEEGVRGRQTETKSIVAIAVEVLEPRGFGRARLRVVPDASADSLGSFVQDVVEPGAAVHTDGWPGYNGLGQLGFKHQRTILSASADLASVSMPAVHRVASLLKRWLLGTHQGSVGPQHVDDYLNEFTFRFNRRTSRSRGLLFYRLLQQAVVTEPAPYFSLVAK